MAGLPAEDVRREQACVPSLQAKGVSSRRAFAARAATRDQLMARSPMVADMCNRTGFTFCQRLQILLWNNERGI